MEFSAGLGLFTTGLSTALRRRLTHLHAHPRHPLTPAAGPCRVPWPDPASHLSPHTLHRGGGHLVEQQPQNALHQPSRGPAPLKPNLFAFLNPTTATESATRCPPSPPNYGFEETVVWDSKRPVSLAPPAAVLENVTKWDLGQYLDGKGPTRPTPPLKPQGCEGDPSMLLLAFLNPTPATETTTRCPPSPPNYSFEETVVWDSRSPASLALPQLFF